MVGEDEKEEWQDTEDYETWQDGYWAEDENWNEGYWADEDLYYKDEYGYFQRKGKGKGKGEKGKKGKDDEGKGGKPGDGKGKSNYVQPQPQFLPAPQQQAHYSSAASTGHGFLTTVEPEPARVETTTVVITQINNQLKPEELDEVVRTDVMKLLDRIEKSANSFLFM